jgi:hypothetical protein
MTSVKENLAAIPLGRSGAGRHAGSQMDGPTNGDDVPFIFGGKEQVVPIFSQDTETLGNTVKRKWVQPKGTRVIHSKGPS